ncbi:MAG: transposase [Bacteroidia bacterium]
MLKYPPEFSSLISPIWSVFHNRRTCPHAELLLLAAVLCTGKRTICNLLRSVGKAFEKRYHKYHRLLSRAPWSELSASCLILEMLIRTFGGEEGSPLVFAMDETVERRWGLRIKARGIYRDAVRSSKSFFVKCSGLRWMVMAFVPELPGTEGRCWALPFFTSLCPSERYYKKYTKRGEAKMLGDWARQMIWQLARWTVSLKRAIYVVGDGSYATYDLLHEASEVGVHMIVRMRMDSRIFDFPIPNPPSKRGPKPKVGQRQQPFIKPLDQCKLQWKKVTLSTWYGHMNKEMEITSGTGLWYKPGSPIVALRWVILRDPEGKLEPSVIATTDLELAPLIAIQYFVRRWRIEVTFAEVRRHLGVETQRQWSDKAIKRSTPILMALFSIVTLWAWRLKKDGKLIIRKAAWYDKKHITFSDALAAVRIRMYEHNQFSTSPLSTPNEELNMKMCSLWEIIASNVA